MKAKKKQSVNQRKLYEYSLEASCPKKTHQEIPNNGMKSLLGGTGIPGQQTDPSITIVG